MYAQEKLVKTLLALSIFLILPGLSYAQVSSTTALPAIGFWNTFNGHSVVAECNFPASSNGSFNLQMLSNSSEVIANIPFTVSPYGTKHIILNPHVPLSSFGPAYGTYVITETGGASSTPLRCLTAYYRMAPSSANKDVEYSFLMQVRASDTGQTNGVINSMNPDTNADATHEWLSVINTDSQPLNALVEIYEQNGTPRPDRNFSITNLQPGARQDFPLGHQWGKVLGLYRLIPTNSAQKYQAFSTRYSPKVGGGFRFAIPLQSREGGCDSGPMTVSTMNPATNWFIIANPTNQAIGYDLDIDAINGSSLHSETTSIGPFQQRHIYINQYLGDNAVGSTRVRCTTPGNSAHKLLFQSMVYGHRFLGTPAVEWAYGTQPSPELADGNYELLTPLNTFLDAANWHKTFNGTNSSQSGTLSTLTQGGCILSQDNMNIASSGATDHGLHERLGQNAIGSSILQLPTAAERFSNELLRVYPHDQGGIGYIANVPGSIVDANDIGSNCSGTTSLQTSVTQYGITWTFDKPYEVGQYANGDFWVKTAPSTGTVKVTAITPDFDGSHHGWEVNPTSAGSQGFDTRISGYQSSFVPSLPYDANSGSSIVKAISVDTGDTSCRPCLKTAAILTVVSDAPPGNGANTFRPPYFGTSKPIYSTLNLRTDLLPNLAPVGTPPTLQNVANDFQRVWLDHKSNWTGRHMHPEDNMPDYGASMAVQTGEAALRLMLNDSIVDKRQAMVNYIQYGIDLFSMASGQTHWPANGGHSNGRKLPMAFAAVMLDNSTMKTSIANMPEDKFGEDGMLYYSATAGRVLFGQSCSESMYWHNQNTSGGSRTCRDPYGYIDGGETPGGSYQACCNSQTWKSHALALLLMPELRTVWNNEYFIQYVDRWVTHGAWTQPDPYAPNGNGALDNKSSDGIGRWPDKHGATTDGGGYGSAFASAMWSTYRSSH